MQARKYTELHIEDPSKYFRHMDSAAPAVKADPEAAASMAGVDSGPLGALHAVAAEHARLRAAKDVGDPGDSAMCRPPAAHALCALRDVHDGSQLDGELGAGGRRLNPVAGACSPLRHASLTHRTDRASAGWNELLWLQPALKAMRDCRCGPASCERWRTQDLLVARMAFIQPVLAASRVRLCNGSPCMLSLSASGLPKALQSVLESRVRSHRMQRYCMAVHACRTHALVPASALDAVGRVVLQRRSGR